MSNDKKFDVSILVSGIRTPNWKGLYTSAQLACKKYKWELIFVSPFDLPEELKQFDNIQLIKDNGSVPRCIQKGVTFLRSDLLFITVDDGFLEEDTLDQAIDLFHEKCTEPLDFVSVKYQENNNHPPDEYWNVSYHVGLNKPGIPQHFKIAMQPLMRKETFISVGGLDCCTFEYLDKPLHDMVYRIQNRGGNVFLSPNYCCNSTWLMGTQGDHGPIHNAEFEHEIPLFNTMYQDPHILSKRNIKFDNWKQAPEVWERRFSKGVPSSYEDLCKQESYDFQGIVYDLESYAIKRGAAHAAEKEAIQKTQ